MTKTSIANVSRLDKLTAKNTTIIQNLKKRLYAYALLNNHNEETYKMLFMERAAVIKLDGAGNKKITRNPEAAVRLLREPVYGNISLSDIDFSNPAITIKAETG